MVKLLEHPVNILRYLCIWTNSRSKLHYLRGITYLVASCFTLYAPVGHMTYYINNFGFSFKHVSKDLSVIVGILFGSFVHIYFYSKHDDVKALLKDLGDFRSFDAPKSVLVLDRKLNRVSELLFRYWMIPSYIIVLLFTFTREFKFERCPDHVVSRCGMAINTVYPFDIFYFPVRECIVLIVNTIGGCLGCGTIYIIMFTTFMSDHIVHRIIHLKRLLIELRSMERGWSRNEHMKYCIRYHQNIIQFAARLSNFSENLYFYYVCITAVILSLISCEAILKLEYLPIWHGVLYVVPLYLSASAGEHIYEHSINISFIIFGCVPWDGDLKLQKDMLFMMTRTNVALTLRVGRFTTYSRPFMLSILKLWYSLLTLLIKIL